MKGLIRFLMTLFVLALIAGTVYYAVVIHGNQNQIINEMKKEENNIVLENNQNSLNVFGNDNQNFEDENVNVSSNQDVVVKFEHTQYATKNMGKDLLGNSVEDFLVTFGVEEIPVMFQKVVNNDGTKITIIPMSDFIDSQEFIYDTDGKLISYRTISNTVGGNVQYIFSDNILTQTINNMEEFVVPVYEEQDEILVRANKLYNL